MIDWLTVIGLVSLGIALIIIEVIFVPGTTIVGIAGLICCGFGVYLGYDYFGDVIGSVILAVSGALALGALVYALKSNAWDRFSLKDENTGRYNDDFKMALSVGDEGETISALKPIGKAIFKDKEMEVRSSGNWISENQKVKIKHIESNKIIVEQI